MGLIILPFLAGVLFIFLKLSYNLVVWIMDKELKPKTLLFGLFFFICSYSALFVSYMDQIEVYAFSAFFRFPLFQVYIPAALIFIIGLSTKDWAKEVVKILSIGLIVCCISFLIFYKYTLGLPDTLEIPTTH